MSLTTDANALPPNNQVRLLWALGDTVRLGIVRELSAGQALHVQALATRLGQLADLISKHLKVLRDCGVIVRVRPPDTDGRQQFHQLPEGSIRPQSDGGVEVDWQMAAVRFPLR